jgi:hypothetical protein
MSDILQIAMTRRNRLKTELTKLEEFLTMAEELSKGADPDEGLTLARSTMAPKPTVVERPRVATNGTTSA